MPRITVDLLRKRSEHNEGIISTLEEISLHQEELEKIEVIGTLCRKLRILYLQNNIIEKIEDLTHMKELRYLNLALNNIKKIEGLQSCEFLDKLDLTVNFVDFDTLEESINHLKPLEHLRELYMLGNPSQSNWEGFNNYVIASLPQLQLLDGKEIHRSDRIKALQVFPRLQMELRENGRIVRERIRQEQEEQEEQERLNNQSETDEEIIEVIDGKATDISNQVLVEDVDDGDKEQGKEKKSVLASDEKIPYTPHSRREMYLEIAEQKEEEEKRKKENMPRERNYLQEHEEALKKARDQNEDGNIRQCNEGKWDFFMEADEDPEHVILEVQLPKYLDSSLIDVDVHPTHVTIVAKNKTLRLRFPEDVNSDAGKAERSRVTGTLKLTLPKADKQSVERCRRIKEHREAKLRDQQEATENAKAKKHAARTKTFDKQTKLSDEILADASKAVKIKGLVKKSPEDESEESNKKKSLRMDAVMTTTRFSNQEELVDDEDEDDPPPIF